MAHYDHLIDRLFQDDDSRRIARAAVEQFGVVPGMDRFMEGGLREFAHINALVGAGEKSPEEGRELLFSTMEGFGLPPHLTGAITDWYDTTLEVEAAAAETSQETVPEGGETEPGRPVEAPPVSRQPPAAATPLGAPSGLSREQIDATIAKWSTAMRAPEGTPEWSSYWRGPGQRELHGAYQAREALDAAPPEQPAAAPEPSQPA